MLTSGPPLNGGRLTKRARRLIAAALLPGAAVAAGCAPDFDDTRPAPLEAVVSIRATGCFVASLGTGAIVDHGLVLTAAHVVSGRDAIEITDNEGVTRNGTIVHSDPDLDIALIEVDGLRTRGLLVASQKMPRGQLAIAALPDTRRRTDRDAPVQHAEVPVELIRPVSLETEDIFIEDDVTRSGYEVRTDIVAGDSGAPILVDREIVAIVWSRSRIAEDRAWAINVSSIRSQIDDPSTRSLTEAERCP